MTMENLQRLTEILHQADEDAFSLASALAHAAEGIVRMDFEGNFIWVNAAYTAITGYIPADLIGKSWTEIPDLVLPDDAAKIQQAYNEMLVRRKSLVEVRGRRPNGIIYWKTVTMVAASDRLGRFIGHYRFIQDITARKAHEVHEIQLIQALAEREACFSAAFDHAQIGMAIVGSDGKFIQVNKALARMTGYTKEELQGLRYQDITHPDDIQATTEMVSRLASGSINEYNLSKRYVRKDGSVLHIDLTGSVVRKQDGSVDYFVVQMIDNSKLIEAKEALKRCPA